MQRDISNLRKSYSKNSLTEKDIPKDPLILFDNWFKEVSSANNKSEINAMTLSTISPSGYPNGRIVLLKYYSPEGFVFFTNYKSDKGVSIDKNNKVSISFFWEDFERQVIINGTASKGSKLGALVSENQSSIIKSKDDIIKKFNHLSNEYLNKEIQRPDYWGGYIVKPIKYEFWQGGENRLHDRIRYMRDKNFWIIDRLSP